MAMLQKIELMLGSDFMSLCQEYTQRTEHSIIIGGFNKDYEKTLRQNCGIAALLFFDLVLPESMSKRGPHSKRK